MPEFQQFVAAQTDDHRAAVNDNHNRLLERRAASVLSPARNFGWPLAVTRP
jgi:hypothetical protein